METEAKLPEVSGEEVHKEVQQLNDDELSLTPKGKENEQEESVDALKARLAKAEQERENYKKGMLKYKKQSRNVRSERENDEENEESDTNDEESVEVEDTGQTANTDDVTKVAREAAMGAIEQQNERLAMSQFAQKYPGLKNPKAWNEVVANYIPRSGKATVDSIVMDLEAALHTTQFYGGGRVAGNDVRVARDFGAVSRSHTSPSQHKQTGLSESTLKMASKFGYTEKDFEGLDD